MDLTVEDLSPIKLRTRLRVLELLSKRRATVTELSNTLNLSKSTVYYHLNCLCERGLIKKRKDGRKWVYYEITDKGRLIVEKRKISVILGIISAISTLTGAVQVWQVCSEKQEIVDSLPVFPYSGIALVAFGICLSIVAYCLKVKQNTYLK
jgi:predicted ArsR family transcriptional regulator